MHTLVNSWMQGRLHIRPPMDRWEKYYAEDRRKQSFFNACRIADPGLALWPEFQQSLDRYRLRTPYERGTISMEVAGLLIADDNRSVGTWLKRSGWLARRGQDPLKRRRNVRATRQLYAAVAQARLLAEQRRFVAFAVKAAQ